MRISFLLSAALLSTTVVLAQISPVPQQYNIVNGDIYTTIPEHGGCPTLDEGELPNWHTTHGTPSYTTIAPGNGYLTLTANYGNPPHWPATGEGMSTDYEFIVGEKYYVDIGVLGHMHAPNCTNDGFEVTIGNNFPIVLTPSLSSCQTFFPTTTYPVYAFSATSTSYIWKLNVLNPTTSYSQIWVKPVPGDCVYDESDRTISWGSIDYVAVYKCVSGCTLYAGPTVNQSSLSTQLYPSNFYYYNINNSNVPSGLTNTEKIALGSCDPNVLHNDPNNNTKLLGRRIDIVNNIEITASSEHWFIAEAVWACRNTGEDCTPPPASKMRQNTIEEQFYEHAQDFNTNNTVNAESSHKQQVTNTDLQISPNPASSSFTITFPSADNYLVKITDMVGTTVYSNSFENTQKQQINTDNLPSGTYTIQVAGSNNSFVQKLVITK